MAQERCRIFTTHIRTETKAAMGWRGNEGIMDSGPRTLTMATIYMTILLIVPKH